MSVCGGLILFPILNEHHIRRLDGSEPAISFPARIPARSFDLLLAASTLLVNMPPIPSNRTHSTKGIVLRPERSSAAARPLGRKRASGAARSTLGISQEEQV
jgi:hypothetical protein